jgi:hypothetical protein
MIAQLSPSFQLQKSTSCFCCQINVATDTDNLLFKKIEHQIDHQMPNYSQDVGQIPNDIQLELISANATFNQFPDSTASKKHEIEDFPLGRFITIF